MPTRVDDMFKLPDEPGFNDMSDVAVAPACRRLRDDSDVHLLTGGGIASRLTSRSAVRATASAITSASDDDLCYEL